MVSNNKIAKESYKYYSGLIGNEYIASEYALKKILDIIDFFNVKEVLEIGSGIGSIAYSIKEYSNNKRRYINYIGTESNEFCKNVLSEYVFKYFSELNLYSEIKDLPELNDIDLIVIDGTDNGLNLLGKFINKNVIIIIEGNRSSQLNRIFELFPNHFYSRLISNYRNPSYGPFSDKNWCGGIQLIFVNPTNIQKIYCYYHRWKTSFNYRYRLFLDKFKISN